MKILGTTLTYNGVDATDAGLNVPSSIVLRGTNSNIRGTTIQTNTITKLSGVSTPISVEYPLNVNGSVTAASFITSSDLRLKEILGNITNATAKLCLLTPFKYKHSKLALEMYSNSENINNNDRYGLSAQELQVVFPEVVSDKFIKDSHGNKYLSVAYSELIPVLVQSIKELNERITSLEGVNSSK